MIDLFNIVVHDRKLDGFLNIRMSSTGIRGRKYRSGEIDTNQFFGVQHESTSPCVIIVRRWPGIAAMRAQAQHGRRPPGVAVKSETET